MASHSAWGPLDPAANEIRLLELLPGKASNPISCTLHVVSLDESPEYEALSYVWGDPANTRSILINNHRHDVGANLEAALRGLRLESKSRHLWADALCINQADIAEKNMQIPKMGMVYSRAPRVLVWLGEPTDAVREAVAWANRYRSAGGFTRHIGRKTSSWFSKAAKDSFATGLDQVAQGYRDIFAHVYFTRMWTVLEVRLASAPPLFVWRDLETSSKTLMSGVHIGLRNSETSSPTWFLNDFAGEQSAGASNSEEASRKATISRANHLIYRFNHPGYHRPDKPYNNLMELLEETSRDGRTCSDPRDHVYALYGLLPDLQQAFPPDYNRSVQEVMHDTARYLPREGDLAGMYQSYTLYDKRLSSSPTPSWVPDLTTRLPLEDPLSSPTLPNQLFTNDSQLYIRLQMDRFGELPVRVQSSGRILRLLARSLGTCHPVIVFSCNIKETVGQLISILESVQDMSIASPGSPWAYIRPPARKDLIRRLTLVFFELRRLWFFRGPDQPFLDDLYRYQATFEMADKTAAARLRKHDFENVSEVVLTLGGKTLFTAMGCVGIGVADLAEGDEIVVGGLSNPAVLRKMTEGGESEDGRQEYKLVGFAYLDGVMDNKCLDRQFVTEEILELDLETFDVC